MLGAPAKLARQLGKNKFTGHGTEYLDRGESHSKQLPGSPAHGEMQHQVGISGTLVTIDDPGVLGCTGQV